MPSCVPCPPGQYAASVGSTSCTACAVGSVAAWNATNDYHVWSAPLLSFFTTSACMQCPPGYNQDQPGQTVCKACQPGYFSGTSGTATCTQCPVGQTSSPGETGACKSGLAGMGWAWKKRKEGGIRKELLKVGGLVPFDRRHLLARLGSG